ncbi:hypothetical protein A3C98_04805 [Candidatus Roizmanbacteria bacterium RIFCSPHIGHO2_02_FULL_37_15]|uniref:Uncharacterized protein n=1 Tax=Candidatus Roizmanbacteria bacterium RIFCSPLOWO2_01_FULL_37_16 TaxID=1802058 RepID=A0A1F7IQM3_9BACT|nr:MAG: hypothetical protein A2859_03450 [Candidatus Roizmanbacteria bacterium RIFCSPHIGHO2_01_FULL_37_16b]OGK22391.1 MAG: hypothetical protein A3C98_04805 [Candidatus Roizmanbacteria bacterium RIFCSPHIGHO2_02_FULL_37_15]OGK32143.1 MAG: hypothetical protein A3F57_03675 [Candidatus Roizmanbacteria bacterium RIFCSPHIGHO2_12_FULL_36_11]OGK45661.1 MAG: hypothetical protein A3B40_04240 [Candidatus Roizmanbacteria bacterium RIFCSPLOWO2_01_FULL_37_16]OGK55769.1 MAG: hypothetical protein A3I50_02380 [C
MKKTLPLLIIFIFLLVGVFGIHAIIDKEGEMTDCPLKSDTASLCPMGIMEHIARWQQMFLAVIPQLSSLLIAFFVSLVGFFLVLKISSGPSPPKTFHLKYFQKIHPESNLFDYLLVAYSSGILQPKIYS